MEIVSEKSITRSVTILLGLLVSTYVMATYVVGTLSEASISGFRLIAGYIFGGNKNRQGSSPEKLLWTP